MGIFGGHHSAHHKLLSIFFQQIFSLFCNTTRAHSGWVQFFSVRSTCPHASDLVTLVIFFKYFGHPLYPYSMDLGFSKGKMAGTKWLEDFFQMKYFTKFGSFCCLWDIAYPINSNSDFDLECIFLLSFWKSVKKVLKLSPERKGQHELMFQCWHQPFTTC